VPPSFRQAVNTRTLGHHTTGVQRYLLGLLPHMGPELRRIAPGTSLQGIKGHLWEQFILPGKVGQDLLWSPGNTGPLRVARQVVTLHDASSLDHPEWFEGKFARWYNWLLPRLAKKAARLITVSADAKNRLVNRLHLPESKVVAIHNGVDARFQPASNEAIASLRNKLDLPSSFFLYVGSLEPRKNLPLLLRAWAQCQREGFQLLVAGTSGHVFRESGLTATENVRFLGRIDDEDLPTLYSSAFAFVFPSLYEGFGLPPLEAMACGCPVISSGTTSLPEVCGPAFDSSRQPDGAVSYFDPADADSTSDAIAGMMARAPAERDQMVQNALRRAALFSWAAAAAKTREVLEQSSLEA
jgi:glycosyltransferase involved in cell wall biosynthesis